MRTKGQAEAEITEAITSVMIRKLANWASSCFQAGVFSFSEISLQPKRASRLAASVAVRPPAVQSRAARAASGVRAWKGAVSCMALIPLGSG